MELQSISSVRDLEAAVALSVDHEIAVRVTELDLPRVTAHAVNLLRDGGRALQARSSLALDDGPAAINADGDWFGVEVRLEHRLQSLKIFA